ncbi:MAG TPA: hypothetical protein VF463_02205 [Sphingobium sp.]
MSAALGTLVRFLLMPGNRFDSIGVAPLIEGIAFGALLAKKAFDSNAIVAEISTRVAQRSSSPSTRDEQSLSRLIPKCTSGGM